MGISCEEVLWGLQGGHRKGPRAALTSLTKRAASLGQNPRDGGLCPQHPTPSLFTRDWHH